MSRFQWTRRVLTMLCIAAALARPALAADPTTPAPDNQEVLRRMTDLEKRFEESEKRHQQELKARDTQIDQLRTQVRQGQQTDKSKTDSIEAQKLDILKQIDSNQPPEQTIRVPANFNPGIAVITDFLGTVSSNKENKALNRVDVREGELDMRAAVDPRADGVLILAIARDAANPLFQNEFQEGPDTAVDLEEAYLFLHDFGVPNLTAKVGRFHVRFGRQNILHAHDLPTSDSAFVNQAFLAPEALTDAGASFSYVFANPWDQYLEAVVEILAGEGGGAEGPVFNGDLRADSPAINIHLIWNTDIAPAWNLELGGSFMTGPHQLDPDDAVGQAGIYGDASLFGGDVTLIHTDPTGGFNNQLFQGEFIYGEVSQPDGVATYAWGAYFLAQQQVNRDWYFGVRLDWTENPDDPTQEVWGVSPYVSWYWSEFLRFRVEYQHKEGDMLQSEDTLMFQVTWIFGAHPPHPYWAMR